jgi:hypothetical protein
MMVVKYTKIGTAFSIYGARLVEVLISSAARSSAHSSIDNEGCLFATAPSTMMA